MKSISKCLVVAVLLSVASAYVYAAAVQSQPPAQQEEKMFQGLLVRIDTDARVLMVKGPDNKDLQFIYTEQTEIVGPEKTVQGLATKSGAKLKITYIVQRAMNHATRIEVLPE